MNKPTDHTSPIRPRRAEPLQPDLPGRGTDVASSPPEDADDARRQQERDSAHRQKQPSEDALDNVRQGYD